MNVRSFTALACAAGVALLGACSSGPQYAQGPYAQGPTAPVYSSAPVYGNQAAQYGQVSRVDVVPAASHSNALGAVLGAVVGGLVGHNIGSGTGRAVATGAGVVGGAVAGNAIEQRTRRGDELFRVGVRFDDGSYREFDFQRVDDLRPGDRVMWDGAQLRRM
jgi:outer membrane lipoprotein SlyB